MNDNKFYEPFQFQPPSPIPIKLDNVLPWDKKEELKQKQQEKDRKFDQIHKEKKKNKGLFASIENGINKSLHIIEKESSKLLLSVNQKIEKNYNENALKRFREYFKLNDTEQLWGEYSCHVIHKKGTFPAYVFISSNYLSIVSDDNLINKKKVQIDIKTIVSIQFAITYSKKGDAPLLQLTDEKEKADGIQVYTSDCKIHLFNKFVQSKTEFANVLDKCWKASYMIQGKYTRQKPGHAPQTPYDNISSQQMNQQNQQNQQMNQQMMYPQNNQMNPQMMNQQMMYQQMNPQMMNQQMIHQQNNQMMYQQNNQMNPQMMNQNQMYPQNQQMYQYNPNQMQYNQQMNPQMMGNQNYYAYNNQMNQNMYQTNPQLNQQMGMNQTNQTKPPPFNPEVQN